MKRFLVEALLVAFVLACGGGATVLFGAHYMTLNWTAPTSMPANSYINLYRGTAPGAESATPINPTGLPATQITYQDDNVQAGGTYYYLVKQCVVPQGQPEICSSSPPEAHATISISSSDVAPPGAFTAVPH